MEATSSGVTEATSVTEATRVVQALDRRRTSRFPLHVCQIHSPVCELLPRQEREPWSMRMRKWSMRMQMQRGQRKGLHCSACAAAAFS